jgi:hypothetical protein
MHSTSGWSQSPRQSASSAQEGRAQKSNEGKSNEGNKYQIYDLSNLGDDAEFCTWVATTIPAVIQPESWISMGGTGNISYFPPTKVLVVYHTPAVHAQVDAFVHNMKKTLPPAKGSAATQNGATTPNMIQAQYAVPKVIQTGEASPNNSYVIPAPAKQPKHLFHFIIRYEGDGATETTDPVKGKAEDTANSSLEQAQVALAKALQTGDPSPLSAFVKPGLAKSKQLFHCIIRYEGEGIVDSNVVELFKSYLGADPDNSANKAKDEVPPIPPTENPSPEPAPPGKPAVTPPTPGTPVPDSSDGIKSPTRSAKPGKMPSPVLSPAQKNSSPVAGSPPAVPGQDSEAKALKEAARAAEVIQERRR